jgi:hypothetical protein
MADSIVTDPSNHAAQRELSSCKKKLLLAAVEFSCSEDKLSLEDLDLAKVHVRVADGFLFYFYKI